MDVSAIEQAISTFGFPIVSFFFLAWYVKYMKDTYEALIRDIIETFTNKLDDMNKKHDEEINDLKNTIDNNTTALQRLCDMFDLRDMTYKGVSEK